MNAHKELMLTGLAPPNHSPLFCPNAGSAPFYVMLMSLAGHGLGALMEAFTPLPPQYGMLLLPAVLANLGVSELEVLSHLRGDVAPVIV